MSLSELLRLLQISRSIDWLFIAALVIIKAWSGSWLIVEKLIWLVAEKYSNVQLLNDHFWDILSIAALCVFFTCDIKLN